MFYLVSYDITDDKRRLKLAKHLENFGDRVQYSVFECLLTNDLLQKMKTGIEKTISPEEDSVRIYPLCANCGREIQIFGQGEICSEVDVYII